MNNNDDIVKKFVEVQLKNKEDFLKIRETLTRIGVASKQNKTLYQSCHILHKRGKYYICHFKELFLLDGKTANISEEDIARRNAIALALQTWGLVEILNESVLQNNSVSIKQIKIIPHSEKSEWRLVAKYNIGQKK